GVAADEGRAARALAAQAAHRFAHDGGAVVARAKFVAAAAELARRGVDHDAAGRGVARERRRAVDHFADRARVAGFGAEAQPRAAAGEADARAEPREPPAELEPGGGFVADGAARAEVRDHGVRADRRRVRAALPQHLERALAHLHGRKAHGDDARDETRNA